MGGGLIQLVARGIDDIYLTSDPQITFFKIIYRRHTNFSVEQIPQKFINPPNFGKKSTCVIAKNGDLMGKMDLVVTLPRIRNFSNTNVLFAWVKKIGFSLIKSIEIEINGSVIDKHYGEWLSIWAELTGEINGPHQRGFKKMIGDIPELTNFTESKDQYVLYIPLKFWFCRSAGLSLPLVALQYSDIKINLEIEDASNCYMLGPTHYIKCRDDIVNFVPFEYIEQNIDGNIIAGIFIDFDISSKRLYYYKITSDKFLSYPVSSSFDTSSANQTAINALLGSPLGLKYSIIGKTSGYSTFAEFNNTTQTYPTTKIRNLNIVDCFLLVDYYFLDDDERLRFAQSRHDYLIEQLYYTPNIVIDGGNLNANLILEHPCKFLTWVTQMKYIEGAKDYYNYTDSYQNKVVGDDNFGSPVGKSLIVDETILLNGNPRLTNRQSAYFDNIQMYQYIKNTTNKGINMYSFASYPFTMQPSGSFNASQVDNIQIQMKLSNVITANNIGYFRGYGVCINILRIIGGLAALVFTK